MSGLWRSVGKRVEFMVTSDRTALSYFTVFFTVEGCPDEYSATHGVGREPIINNQFGFTDYDNHGGSFYASGIFNSPNSASGIVGMGSYYVQDCGYVSGESDWEATWQGLTVE